MNNNLLKGSRSLDSAPLLQAILEVYLEFRKICEANGLRHYVIGGTLLGAVRHKGFIPWDDDFDVAMPRKDFESFQEYAKAHPLSGLSIVNRRNTPEMSVLYFKVQSTDAVLLSQLEDEVGRKIVHGVYIDVFPLDGYPKSLIGSVFAKLNEMAHLAVLRFYRRKTDRPRTILGVLNVMVGSVCSRCIREFKVRDNAYLDNRERYFSKIPFDDQNVSGTCGVRVDSFQMIFPRRLWADVVELPFENIEVPAPRDYDCFLKINYGDYMKMPPAEKRRATHGSLFVAPWRLGPTCED